MKDFERTQQTQQTTKYSSYINQQKGERNKKTLTFLGTSTNFPLNQKGNSWVKDFSFFPLYSLVKL